MYCCCWFKRIWQIYLNEYDYWFIKTYLLFLIILPLLNLIIEKLPKKLHCALCWAVFPVELTVLILEQCGIGLGGLDILIFIFLFILCLTAKNMVDTYSLKKTTKREQLSHLYCLCYIIFQQTLLVVLLVQNITSLLN